MKVRELFKPIGTRILQAADGSVDLDRNNCQIVNRSKNEDSVLLHFRRDSDEKEGRAYLRPKDEFKSMSSQLLRWAFTGERITGLTLNQLEDLETNFNVENVQGRLQISKN